MKNRLLREYVRTLVSEMDFGGIGDGGYGSYSYGDIGMGRDGGVGGWGGKSVLSVFGSPFLDVAKTAVGVGKEFGAHAKGLARTGVEAALSLVLPFVQGEYDKISKETSEEVQKVKKEYQDLYKKNLDAFFNTDLVTLAFFVNPIAVITGAAFDRFLYGAPDAAISVIGWFIPISGRKLWEKLMRLIDPERIQRILKAARGEDGRRRLIVWDDKNRRRLYQSVRRAMGIEPDPNSKDDDNGPIESATTGGFLIIEEKGMTFQDVARALLRDSSIIDAMKNSEQAQALRERGKKILAKKLGSVVQLAQRVTSVTSFEELARLTGQNVKGDPKDLEKVKASVKESLSKALLSELEGLKKLQLDPETIGLSRAYEIAISQIETLPVNNTSQYGTVTKRGDEANGKEQQGNGTGSTGPVSAGRANGTKATDRGIHQATQYNRK